MSIYQWFIRWRNEESEMERRHKERMRQMVADAESAAIRNRRQQTASMLPPTSVQSSSDDSLGFAIGLATGVPVPFSGPAVIGAALHNANQSSPSYSSPSSSSDSYSSSSSSSSSYDSGSSSSSSYDSGSSGSW